MVGLIDCDNFFCSCERVFRPDLERKPLVVLSNNDGCIVARSKEVKAMGLKECMPYYQLVRDYPDAGIVAFSSNYELYGDMSARVMAILGEEVPEIMQYSIDEAFLNLEGMRTDDMKGWGEALCRKVQRSTGLPVSLGIAPTKTLAKLATHFAKRYPGYNKCCVIADEYQRERALRLSDIGDVWGIGRHMCRRLDYYGIKSAYDFTERSRHWIRSKFHVTGERTWCELRGENAIGWDEVEGAAKKSILTSRSFPGMITDVEDLKSHVANYAARCAAKLRRQKSACALVKVFVSSNRFREDLPQYGGEAFYTFATPTDTTMEIVNAATKMVETIYREGICYKRAGVMVDGLTPADVLQPDLFSYDPDRRKKQQAVSATLDSINGALGADTVVLGAQQYRQQDASGGRITFVNAIRRALKSPNYSTSMDALTVR